MQANISDMARLAADGVAANEIARRVGANSQTVRNTVRKILPNAFRRNPVPMPAAGAVTRMMPHNPGGSTGLPTHHAVSLPRLSCLA